MSTRRYGKARRKAWDCGHRGWGDDCHRCKLADRLVRSATMNIAPPPAYRGRTDDELAAEAARLRSADRTPVLDRLYRRSTATIASAFVVLLAVLGHGCTTAGGNTHVDWPGIASCAPNTSDLVGSVSRVLLGDGDSARTSISDRAVSELEDLARRETPGIVACLVDELVRGWSRPGAAQEPNRVAATQRGRDFLDRVAKTSVTREGEP